MVIKALLLFLLLGSGFFYSLARRKLTLAAALTGAALALCVYAGAGFTGVSMMTLFFILGSAATSWKLQWKRQQSLAENEKGMRTAMQVVANAGVPAILGLLGFLYMRIGPLPWYRGVAPSVWELYWWTGPLLSWERAPIFSIMMAGAFAAATADTLSSELGNIYGRRYYTILGFKKDQRGLNGVISLEGTLCGLAGSLLIALIFSAGFGWNGRVVLIIVLAGTIGNLTDSLLGATLERKHRIGNNAVNFLNTAVAAGSVWVLQWIF